MFVTLSVTTGLLGLKNTATSTIHGRQVIGNTSRSIRLIATGCLFMA
jgi:hypothetical protein